MFAVVTLKILTQQCYQVCRALDVHALSISGQQPRLPGLTISDLVPQGACPQRAVVGSGRRAWREPLLLPPHRLSIALEQSAKAALLESRVRGWGDPILTQRAAPEPTPSVKELLRADLVRRGDLGRCCAILCAVGLSSLLLRFGDAESLRSVSGWASKKASGMRSSTSWLARKGRLLVLQAHCTNCSARGMASLHSRSWLQVRDVVSQFDPKDGGLEMQSGSIQSWRLGRRSVLQRLANALDAPHSRRDEIEEMFLREGSRSMGPLTEMGIGMAAEDGGGLLGSDQTASSLLALAKGERESRERRLLDCCSGSGPAWNAEALSMLCALSMLTAALC